MIIILGFSSLYTEFIKTNSRRECMKGKNAKIVKNKKKSCLLKYLISNVYGSLTLDADWIRKVSLILIGFE